ncbi:hypothetical protein LZ554_000798 [Drepanopeziza brunnea f. sp. 'monogermtubi']|nr:hypothetical protein LZ554_000798 [Drepanopeziza brunnea f. sp. 'monogermtubi']
MNATPKSSPERAFALQKYLLLHSQHDALQKHLAQISSAFPSTMTSPTSTPSRSRFPSVSSSTDSEDGLLMSSPYAEPNNQRRGSIPRLNQRPQLHKRRSSLPTVVDESILDAIDEDENKLKDVNMQIKQTLTDLLNCESVRNDNKYRLWVQTRLMDAEKELKGSRARSFDRRRSEDVGGGMMY